jgi:peptide/nickel transport system substrate-binding protein
VYTCRRLVQVAAVCVLMLGCLFIVHDPAGAATHPRGGTLIYVRSADSNFLDAGFTTITEDLDVVVNVLDTLVTATEKGEIKPALATAWKSSDNKVWTFELRQGVKFHDGSLFTSEDVVFSIGRHIPGSGMLSYAGRTSALGLWMGDLIESVETQGDYRVTITLAKPYAFFLHAMASSPASIVSKKAAEKAGDGFALWPIGTGPFKMTEWIKGDRLVLTRNSDYWDGKAPYLDRVVFKVVPDPSSRLLELKAGSGSFIKGILADQRPIVEGDPKLNLLVKPASSVGYLAINVTKPPFDNVLVRRAINHAIDKQAILDTILGGLGTVPNSMIPEWMAEYNAEVEPYEYNPAKAKALLAEAGFPNGFKTELWTFNVERPFIPNVVQVAEKIENDLSAVGINARLSIIDSTVYWKSINTLQHQLAMKGWYTPPLADFLIRVARLGAEAATGYPMTSRGKELVAMAAQASQTSDEKLRNAIYGEIQRIYAEDAPDVPLVHAAYIWAHNKEFKNVSISPDGLTRFGEVYYSK